MGLLDSVGNFLGVAGSSLVSPIASVASGLFNTASAADRQSAAQEFSAQQFATRYQTQVADMKAAGLNPMLSYMQGPGSAPTSSAASTSGMPDVGASITQSRIANAQLANMEKQGDLLEAQAMEHRASAWAKNNSIEVQNMQVKEIQQKLENQYYANDVERLKAIAKELNSQYELNMQKGLTEQQARGLMFAQAQKLNSETKLLDFDIDAIKKFDNFAKEYKQYQPIVDLVKALFLPRSGGITINK